MRVTKSRCTLKVDTLMVATSQVDASPALSSAWAPIFRGVDWLRPPLFNSLLSTARVRVAAFGLDLVEYACQKHRASRSSNSIIVPASPCLGDLFALNLDRDCRERTAPTYFLR